MEDEKQEEAVPVVEEEVKTEDQEAQKQEDEQSRDQDDDCRNRLHGEGHQHCDRRGKCQERSLVMHGRATTAEKLSGKMGGSPAKMHSIRGTSENNSINFKTISVHSPKQKRKNQKWDYFGGLDTLTTGLAM